MPKSKICIRKICFSVETVKRLSLYLRDLRKLAKKKIQFISSNKITQLLNISPAQFRKDLSYFGEFGKRGVGYEVEKLIKKLEEILGINKEWRIAVVGVGRLGSALLRFEGFSKFNIKIKTAFDIDKKKIGKVINGIKIEDVGNLERVIKKEKIKLSLICTPPQVAQDITNRLVSAGIRGILNFAPVALKVANNVFISNVDMACELEQLIFLLNNER
ncbi:MAG: redox-sensing transcriptional repressor Rex [Candidatus Omnitrophica bacterium]|nr:redox-sensing transcriptional repressor Rex [Candidatus Omnitrophota bacterium]